MGSQKSQTNDLATKQGRLFIETQVHVLSGSDALYISTKQMLFSVLTRKGRSLGTTIPLPTEVQVLAEEADLSWQLP